MQKRNMYLWILALALGLLVLVAGIAVTQQAGIEPMQYIQFRENVQGMELVPHYDEKTDTWYLFLPAYAGPENIRITAAAGVQVNLEDLPLGQRIPVQVGTPFRTREYALEIQQCTNLPTLSLDAEPGALEYIHSSLNHEKDVFVTMVDAQGNPMLQQVATLSGRGNGTWAGEKRPYGLNFSTSISEGPFQNISKLCLLAEAYDETKLRNSLAYYAGTYLDIPYGSAYQYCNLYVSGEYRGIYGITTKEEYTKSTGRDGIQGVFEYTSYPKENQFFAYPSLQPIRVMYGSMEEVKYAVDDFCAALEAQDWAWCAELIDMDSFARKYVMDEFFINYDLGFSSQYFYIGGDGRIRCMLPWDYDWSMGSSYGFYDLPAVQVIEITRFPEYWNAQLLQYEGFRQAVIEVLTEYYTDDLFSALEKHMTGTIDWISGSLACDELRWQHASTLNLYDGTPDREYLMQLKNQYSRYYPQRRDFLHSFYSNPEDYCRVQFQAGGFPTFYLPKGEDLWENLGDYFIWEGRYLNYDIQPWRTPEGLTPQQVGTVQQDVIFTTSMVPKVQPQAEPQPETVPVLDSPLGKGILLGCTALVLLLLVLTECRRHPARKKKNEVAV